MYMFILPLRSSRKWSNVRVQSGLGHIFVCTNRLLHMFHLLVTSATRCRATARVRVLVKILPASSLVCLRKHGAQRFR